MPKKPLFSNHYLARCDTHQSLLKWQWERLTSPNRRRPEKPIKGVQPNLPLLHDRHFPTPRFTWVGHATLLIQLPGCTILTDPNWNTAASPFPLTGFKRHQPPGVAFSDLPFVDYVLISHDHYDHLDKKTICQLMAQTPRPPHFLVPKGMELWFQSRIRHATLAPPQQNVWAFNWYDTHSLPSSSGTVTAHFLPIQHWSGRSLWDRYQTLWGSWALTTNDFSFWFSGDLGYSKDIPAIYHHLRSIDVAAISIGAYAPEWFMQLAHISPEESVQAMQDLHAKSALAIHWGTFENLSDEPLDEPPKRLYQALIKANIDPARFAVPRHGETMLWDGNTLTPT